MPLSYQNRYQQVFYFKKVSTTRGFYRYYTTKEPSSDCVEQIPEGYEIYEHPENGLAFMRKKMISHISSDEIETIERAVARFADVKDYILDVKKTSLTIFTSDINIETLQRKFPKRIARSKKTPMQMLRQVQRFDPMLMFELEHEILRSFRVKRRSMVGFRESWISLTCSNHLEQLAQDYCVHLGRDSFYNLKPRP